MLKKTVIVNLCVMVSAWCVLSCSSVPFLGSNADEWVRRPLKEVNATWEIKRNYMRSYSGYKNVYSESKEDDHKNGISIDIFSRPISLGAFYLGDIPYKLNLSIIRLNQESYNLFVERKHWLSYDFPKKVCKSSKDLIEFRQDDGYIPIIRGEVPVYWIRKDVEAPNGDMIVCIGKCLIETDKEGNMLPAVKDDIDTTRRMIASVVPN